MLTVLVSVLAGSLAQLVDGSLGMGFGVTASSLLLFLGLTPVVVSTATHLAELPTSFASAVAHLRAGNVDRSLLLRIGIPGALTAFLGAVALSSLNMAGARVWMSLLLLILGVFLILRFGFGLQLLPSTRLLKSNSKFLPVLGAAAGTIDATGGGGWGPTTVPTLLTLTDHSPRKVVGTANTSEFFVTVAALLGFLVASSFSGIPWATVIGLSVGGVLFAPVAARLTAKIPQESLGILVGGLVIAVNARYVIPESILPVVLIAVAVPIFYLAWKKRPRPVVTAEPVAVPIST